MTNHVVGKWTNVDRVHTPKVDAAAAGWIEVPSTMVAVVNGIVRPERRLRIRRGDRVDFRRR